jgi:transposase-like protein
LRAIHQATIDYLRYPRTRVRQHWFVKLAKISKKRTMPLRDWKAALTRFTIQFEEKMPKP